MDDSLPENPRDRVRDFLLRRLSIGLQRPHRGPWGAVLRPYARAPGLLHAFEYESVDADRNQCIGVVLAAWQVDAAGIRPVEATPETLPRDRIGLLDMWYRYPFLQFFIAPGGDWLVLASVFGPRAGHGGRFRIVHHRGTFTLFAEGIHWKS